MRVVSQKTGLTAKTLSLLANGKVQGIKYPTLIKIKRYFDCSFNDLFEIIDE